MTGMRGNSESPGGAGLQRERESGWRERVPGGLCRIRATFARLRREIYGSLEHYLFPLCLALAPTISPNRPSLLCTPNLVGSFQEWKTGLELCVG